MITIYNYDNPLELGSTLFFRQIHIFKGLIMVDVTGYDRACSLRPVCFWIFTALSAPGTKKHPSRTRLYLSLVSNLTTFGGFHKCGYPNSWMVYNRTILVKRMIWGYPNGNLHFHLATFNSSPSGVWMINPVVA